MLTARDQLRYRARATGTKRFYQSFPSPTGGLKNWPFRQYFHPSTPPTTRQALGTNKASIQSYAIVRDGTLSQITDPITVTDANGRVLILGTICDQLDHLELVGAVIKESQRWFITIAELDVATSQGLAMATTPTPDEVGPPATKDGDGNDNTPAPSNDRLNFPDNDLCFTAFPVMLPIPPGINIPPDHPVHEPLPQETSDLFPTVEAFRKAASWQIKHNNGLSIDKGGPMFDQTELAKIVPAGIFASFMTTNDAITVNYESIRRGTDLHRTAHELLTNTGNEAWERIGMTLPVETVTPTAPTAPPPRDEYATAPPNNGFSVALLESLVEKFGSTKTKEEKDSSELAKEAEMIFGLLTATITTDALGEQHIVLGDLTEAFKGVLNESNLGRSAHKFEAGMKATLEAVYLEQDARTFQTTLDPAIFDKALATSVRNGRLMSQGFMGNTMHKDALGILQFATPSIHSKEFKDRVHSNQDVQTQREVGNDTSTTKVNNELYSGGRLNTYHDATNLISNFLVVLKFICNNPEKTDI